MAKFKTKVNFDVIYTELLLGDNAELNPGKFIVENFNTGIGLPFIQEMEKHFPGAFVSYVKLTNTDLKENKDMYPKLSYDDFEANIESVNASLITQLFVPIDLLVKYDVAEKVLSDTQFIETAHRLESKGITHYDFLEKYKDKVDIKGIYDIKKVKVDLNGSPEEETELATFEERFAEILASK